MLVPRRSRTTLGAMLCLLTACATGSGPGEPVPGIEDTAVAEDSTTPAPGGRTSAPGSSATTADDAADPGEARVTLTTIADGFEQPVDVLPAPDGVLVVAEQVGRVTTIDGEVRLDLAPRTTYGGERGLLDIVFHPDGDRLFVHHSGTNGETVLAEYPVSPDGTIDDDGRTVLFTTPQPAANHNGGSLVFLPDGTLLLALGDGGRSGDAFDQAQDTSTPLGGLLRFDVSVPGQAEPAGADLDEPALWAYGLRNPWRIAVDDDVLYVADVGQDAVEEVSFLALDDAAGANFGWPFVEGDQCFATDPCDGPFVPSTVNLDHEAEGGPCSITGGTVYRGTAIPDLVGTYLYSDLCLGNLSGFAVRDGAVAATVDLTDQVDVTQVIGFGTDLDGELLLTQLNGEIRRLDPA